MSNPIRQEALIHDLAIVLAGSLHPSAEIGPAPRLAAHRIRDVLGIGDGAPVRIIEPLIAAALADPAATRADPDPRDADFIGGYQPGNMGDE
jgi:hypothetical protein